MVDHYDVLGVSRTAPSAVIRAAYRALMRETHPDQGGTAEQAQKVNEAFEVLSDPRRREAYDAELARAHEAAVPSAPAATQGVREVVPIQTPSNPYPEPVLTGRIAKAALGLLGAGMLLATGGALMGDLEDIIAAIAGVIAASLVSWRRSRAVLVTAAVFAVAGLAVFTMAPGEGEILTAVGTLLACAGPVLLRVAARRRTRALEDYAARVLLDTAAEFQVPLWVVDAYERTARGLRIQLRSLDTAELHIVLATQLPWADTVVLDRTRRKVVAAAPPAAIRRVGKGPGRFAPH